MTAENKTKHINTITMIRTILIIMTPLIVLTMIVTITAMIISRNNRKNDDNNDKKNDENNNNNKNIDDFSCSTITIIALKAIIQTVILINDNNQISEINQ